MDLSLFSKESFLTTKTILGLFWFTFSEFSEPWWGRFWFHIWKLPVQESRKVWCDKPKVGERMMQMSNSQDSTTDARKPNPEKFRTESLYLQQTEQDNSNFCMRKEKWIQLLHFWRNRSGASIRSRRDDLWQIENKEISTISQIDARQNTHVNEYETIRSPLRNRFCCQDFRPLAEVREPCGPHLLCTHKNTCDPAELYIQSAAILTGTNARFGYRLREGPSDSKFGSVLTLIVLWGSTQRHCLIFKHLQKVIVSPSSSDCLKIDFLSPLLTATDPMWPFGGVCHAIHLWRWLFFLCDFKQFKHET